MIPEEEFPVTFLINWLRE